MMAKPVVYFAYGSNMSTAWLRMRTPGCVPLGIATLPGHVLRFHKRSNDGSGKCNALAGGNDTKVIGVLFSFDPAELAELDRAEGAGTGYESAMVTVTDEAGDSRKVLTYLATPDHIDDSLKPYGWYKDVVLAGAREHGLPSDYIAGHIEPVEAVEDPDKRRDSRQRAKFERAGR